MRDNPTCRYRGKGAPLPHLQSARSALRLRVSVFTAARTCSRTDLRWLAVILSQRAAAFGSVARVSRSSSGRSVGANVSETRMSSPTATLAALSNRRGRSMNQRSSSQRFSDLRVGRDCSMAASTVVVSSRAHTAIADAGISTQAGSSSCFCWMLAVSVIVARIASKGAACAGLTPPANSLTACARPARHHLPNGTGTCRGHDCGCHVRPEW